MSSFYEVVNYIWPLLTVFQLVVSVIAVQRLGSAGAKLMLAGSALAILVSGYFFVRNYMDLNSVYTGELELEYVASRVVSLIAQVLFLIGVLKVASQQIQQEEPLGRTEF